MKYCATEVHHKDLLNFVLEMKSICTPEDVYWCDGSAEEYGDLCQQLVEKGTFILLNPDKWPNSFAAFSDPSGVARVEDRTYICSRRKEDAGPTNNWVDPREMKAHLKEMFRGSMRGRTMYVSPFCMGPIGSPISKIGVQITDSAYVVVNLHIMTRMGKAVIDELGADGEYIKCLHSVGAPLEPGQPHLPWPCNPTKKYIQGILFHA